MSNEDGTVWITYNGEIYNHAALRAQLEALGHKYRSRTDTETIIHAYEQWGVEAVNRVEGMFAFAIYDSRTKELWMARDRIGKKPLYFTIQKDQIIFGSEIKAILEHPHVSRDVEPLALYHYLTFITTPAPLTMFSGIFKLPPGHWLRFSADGKREMRQYWDALPNPANFPIDVAKARDSEIEECAVALVRKILPEAVAKRMMSDVPFGVFLSGGIDSSLNVALMDQLMDRPVGTFTVGFKGQEEYNELVYARQIADRFKTDHHEVLITQQDLVEHLPQMVFHQDEPIADWVCVPLYFVSKLVRDSGTIVVQVGEGSDEQFCGYEQYKKYVQFFHRVWEPMLALPRRDRRFVWGLARAVSQLTGRGAARADAFRRLAKDQELFLGGAICWWGWVKEKLVKQTAFPLTSPAFQSTLVPEDFKHYDSHRVVKHYVEKLRQACPRADFLTKISYLEFKIRLPELLLMRVDKVTMSTSIEARVPFLDHKLVEMTMNIPERVKLARGVTKSVLKKAARGIIPDNIIDRPKQGFGAPVSEYLRGDFGDYARRRIFESPLRKRGYFNYDFLEKIINIHTSGKVDQAFQIWNILNLTLWYEHWIEKKTEI